MGNYLRVLVGTDGSETSFRAVDRAAVIAKATGAQLVIATAYRPSSAREQESAGDLLGADAAFKVTGSTPSYDMLREAAERAQLTAGCDDIDTVAVQGEPVDVLVSLIEERKIDLLVVGNRGLNTLTGRLLGSVPSAAAHRAGCDVLIVATT